MIKGFTERTSSKSGASFPKLGICLAILAVSMSANARLGGDSGSILTDQVALKANLKVTAGASYTDYALSLPDGIVVHEFLNQTGQVFEVTWSGKGHRPDMTQILGEYATRFARKTGPSRPTDRHSDRVEADLVVHSLVHNRYFSGTAHVPGMIPAGMSNPVRVPVEAK